MLTTTISCLKSIRRLHPTSHSLRRAPGWPGNCPPTSRHTMCDVSLANLYTNISMGSYRSRAILPALRLALPRQSRSTPSPWQLRWRLSPRYLESSRDCASGKRCCDRRENRHTCRRHDQSTGCSSLSLKETCESPIAYPQQMRSFPRRRGTIVTTMLKFIRGFHGESSL